MDSCDIAIWSSDKARGHNARRKYHLFIGIDRVGKLAFFFINSENYYNEGFLLKKAKYAFLKRDSYIGCTSLIRYARQEMDKIQDIALCGNLDNEDRERLAIHISQSEVIEQRDIDFILSCLEK